MAQHTFVRAAHPNWSCKILKHISDMCLDKWNYPSWSPQRPSNCYDDSLGMGSFSWYLFLLNEISFIKYWSSISLPCTFCPLHSSIYVSLVSAAIGVYL